VKSSEIAFCSICRTEYELLFVDEECVSQTNCKCARNIKPKKLDEALLKIGEFLNEKSNFRSRKISKRSSNNSKE
jgi:hypothetical protein